MTAQERVAEMRARAMAKPCGFRGKYTAGCRCAECTRANREYNARRQRERIRTRETAELVDAAPARRHLRKLSRQGCGYKQAADAAGIGKSTAIRILTGEQRVMRACALRRLLAVDAGAAADHALVDAAPTWRLIGELVELGYRKAWLSAWLGTDGKSLQVGKAKCTVAKAARVRKLYDDLMAGRIRRER